MSDDKQEEGQPQQVFVPVTAQPAPEPDKDTKDTKDTKKKQDKSDVPVGQIAASGAGATVLGSYALASAVGPWGWAAAPAAAVVGGAGYVAYRRRKKRGGSERSTKTTITRTRGGTRSRGGFGGLRGGGSGSGRGLKGATSTRSGGVPSSSRSGGLPGKSSTLGSTKGGGAKGRGTMPRTGSAPRGTSGSPFGRGAAPRTGGGGTALRKGRGLGRTSGGGSGFPRIGGGRTSGGGLFGRGGSSPRSGGSGGGLLGRGAASRGAKGGTTPRGGSSSRRGGGPLWGRGSDSTTGGSIPKNRWGSTPSSTSDKKRPGRIRRAGARARDWADDKTGRRMSAGWKAARNKKGLRNRSRAARSAAKKSGGGWFMSGLVGFLAAIGTAIATLFGKGKEKTDSGAGTSDKKAEAADASASAGAAPGAAAGAAPPPSPATPPQNRPRGGPCCPDNCGSQKPGPPKNCRHTKSHRPVSTPSTTGGNTMAGLPAAQIAHDMAGAMARYEPADAYQVVPDSRQWEDVPTQVAFAVKAYADRLEGARFPINEAINDKLREFAQAIAATRAIAEELEPLMRKAHAQDIERQETPRGDESKWNIH